MTTTITTEEYSALLAVQRAATVIAAGEQVNEHEHEQALDALPHLLDAVAAEQSNVRSLRAMQSAVNVTLARTELAALLPGVVTATAIAGVDEQTRCECGSTTGPFVLDREGCWLCPDCAATSRWCGKRTWGGHCGLDVSHEGRCVPDDEATRALRRERRP
ncbi:hypothetical protein [Cellulosimicrobium sp. I38E]|uniref:hypothetical protein n=1 Tax=Cellulosimicrobium sp. I38E TaxID=1393139 RepID=UPI000AD28A01|nr:hypothetical protein [Cellulosimicrobium sp. I38E]